MQDQLRYFHHCFGKQILGWINTFSSLFVETVGCVVSFKIFASFVDRFLKYLSIFGTMNFSIIQNSVPSIRWFFHFVYIFHISLYWYSDWILSIKVSKMCHSCLLNYMINIEHYLSLIERQFNCINYWYLCSNDDDDNVWWCCSNEITHGYIFPSWPYATTDIKCNCISAQNSRQKKCNLE